MKSFKIGNREIGGDAPVFIIAEDGRTMAEVPRDEKNAISHRGLAAAKLRAALGSGR